MRVALIEERQPMRQCCASRATLGGFLPLQWRLTKTSGHGSFASALKSSRCMPIFNSQPCLRGVDVKSEMQRSSSVTTRKCTARCKSAAVGKNVPAAGTDLIRNRSGQSLLETALLLPLLLTIIFNAVNVGYFFFVALNLAAAPRLGAEYSIQGSAGFQQSQLPSAASISSLVYGDIVGAIPATANTPTRVCSLSLGLNPTGKGTSSQIPNCASYGSAASFPAPDPDPEAPYLVLNRVDIQYTVTPLIPGKIFNLVLPPSLTFHRIVDMRVME